MMNSGKPHFIFLTAFYVLMACASHEISCWLWQDALAREGVIGWYTFGYNFSHDYRFFSFWMLLWLGSSFSCALFPYLWILRLGTAISTTYILNISGLLDSTGWLLTLDLLQLLPLWILALLPNHIIKKYSSKVIKNIQCSKEGFIRLSCFLLWCAFIVFWYPRFTYKFGLYFAVSVFVSYYAPALQRHTSPGVTKKTV